MDPRLSVYPSIINFFNYKNAISTPGSGFGRATRISDPINGYERSICCEQCPLIIQSRVLLQFIKVLLVVMIVLISLTFFVIMSEILSWSGGYWALYEIMMFGGPVLVLITFKVYALKLCLAMIKNFSILPENSADTIENGNNVLKILETCDINELNTSIDKYSRKFHELSNKFYYGYVADVFLSFLAAFWWLLILYDACIDDIYSGGGKDGDFVNDESGYCQWVSTFDENQVSGLFLLF